MRLTRRQMLMGSWKVLAAGLAVDAGWMMRDVLRPLAETGLGRRLVLGPPEQFREGRVTYVREGRFYVARSGGELRALSQRCTHLGCRVPFCESSGRFECPCHGSVFNLKGEYVRGPAPRGMDRFPVGLDRGRVVVGTETILTGPPRGVRTLRDRPGRSCLAGSGEA